MVRDLIQYFLTVAHSADRVSDPGHVKGQEDTEEFLLVLYLHFTQNSKVEYLVAGASAFSEACTFCCY